MAIELHGIAARFSGQLAVTPEWAMMRGAASRRAIGRGVSDGTTSDFAPRLRVSLEEKVRTGSSPTARWRRTDRDLMIIQCPFFSLLIFTLRQCGGLILIIIRRRDAKSAAG